MRPGHDHHGDPSRGIAPDGDRSRVGRASAVHREFGGQVATRVMAATNSVQTWHAAAGLADDFSERLSSFGAPEELSDWARQYARDHAGRCQWDADFLAARFPSGRYLNIGGSPYVFELALKRMRPDADIVSVDIDPTRFPGVETALGVRVLGADIERGDCDLGRGFDCVVVAEVFEHLRIDLLGTISRLRETLAPAGVLYLTMPNGLGLNAIRGHLLHGRTGPSPVGEWAKLRRLGHMGHVREYSMTELREVMEYCGFVIDTSMYREAATGRSRLRAMLLALCPSLASEIVILARRRD
jgi:SAM-dependent methyltransferase